MSISKLITKKKYCLWLAAGIILLGVLVYHIGASFSFWPQLSSFFNSTQDITIDEQPTLEPTISSVIVNHYRFTASQDDQTPFSLLLAGAQVEYEQYDFGVFVTSINGQQADSNYYWAVYVDGEYATQASDQIPLVPGSIVEWRWEEVKATE